MNKKTVLILGANSDVAKECIKVYISFGYYVIAASRNLIDLQKLMIKNEWSNDNIQLLYFDVSAYDSHQKFYQELTHKPNIVIYAAGFLVQNEEAFLKFPRFLQMASVNFLGAVSILNIIALDKGNINLERIIGLSSLSGVRGRKSNFMYGSTKSAFTQYLAGLRQELSSRNIIVNVVISGYINTKINGGLELNKSLIMKPEYVANYITNAGKSFTIIPDFKWKIIYYILKILPESLVAKLP